MAWFSDTPEETAAKQAAKAQAAREKAERKKAEEESREAEAFARSPAGQARAAKAAGRRLFELQMQLSETKGHVVAMMGAFTDVAAFQAVGVLESIEREGWRLEHAGYAFVMTGSESRDKFLASGQQQAVSGHVKGFYIFRSV